MITRRNQQNLSTFQMKYKINTRAINVTLLHITVTSSVYPTYYNYFNMCIHLKFESQGESIQDSCKTSNDVRCRDVGSEESTREEVGCGGNEDVMDEWSHQVGQKE